MKQIDKLAWIEIQNNGILMTKSFGKEIFYIPGGKREIGETNEQALLREIEEELTVSLDAKTLDFIGVFEAAAHGQSEGITVKMTCYSGKYTGTIKANAEIAAIDWYNYADRAKVGPVDKIIFDYLYQNNFLT
jgi:8-oxo-dGTP diphosphatase